MVLLEILILISAISVALAPALIRSALFLMVTFLLSGFLIALFGAEALALLFLLVYIGAISVLFLFVIMLLQVTKNQVSQFSIISEPEEEHAQIDTLYSLIIGAFILIFLFTIFLFIAYSFPLTYHYHPTIINREFENIVYENSEIHALGVSLFINHWMAFVIITFIIIMASFGVIIILK